MKIEIIFLHIGVIIAKKRVQLNSLDLTVLIYNNQSPSFASKGLLGKKNAAHLEPHSLQGVYRNRTDA